MERLEQATTKIENVSNLALINLDVLNKIHWSIDKLTKEIMKSNSEFDSHRYYAASDREEIEKALWNIFDKLENKEQKNEKI